MSETEVLEYLADYFNEISSEFSDVKREDIPKTYDRQTTDLTEETVRDMLIKMKKPKSMVPGDIPPSLVGQLASTLAYPLSLIYNAMPTSTWPDPWKKEYQTVIPKKTQPTSANECRNISCTNLFSKTLETFVLQSLLSEVDLSDFQFGGIKGTGVNHFLAKM